MSVTYTEEVRGSALGRRAAIDILQCKFTKARDPVGVVFRWTSLISTDKKDMKL